MVALFFCPVGGDKNSQNSQVWGVCTEKKTKFAKVKLRYDLTNVTQQRGGAEKMDKIIAYADIPDGYAGNWVRVGFKMVGNAPVCVHDNGMTHRCAFLPDMQDAEELLYCINPKNKLKYSKYIRDFDGGTDWSQRKNWGYKGKGISTK